MKKRRRSLSILTLSFLIALPVLLVSLATPASGATDNYALSVPMVRSDRDEVALGTLIIREDASSNGFFADNDVITINLPNGVAYHAKATSGTVSSYVYTTDGFDIVLSSAGDGYISFALRNVGSPNPTNERRIYVAFNGPSAVDIDNGVTGDIVVEINADGTAAVTSEFITVARVVEGDTVTTISHVEAIAPDSDSEIGTIRIRESVAGVLDVRAGADPIQLVLPKDFKWNITNLDADSVSSTAGLGVTRSDISVSTGGETLSIDMSTGGTVSRSASGFISLSDLWIVVPEEADEGDVEMTIKGNKVTEKNIVIAKVSNFGVIATYPVNGSKNVPVKSDITVTFSENIKPGDSYSEIALYKNDSTIPSSRWINGSILTIYPANNLEYSVSYTVYIPTKALENYDNLSLPNSYLFSFSTTTTKSGGGGSSSRSNTSLKTNQQPTAPNEIPTPQVVTPLTTETNNIITSGPQVTVNGQPVNFDVAPEIKEGRTFIPVRSLAYSLGVTADNVSWDGTTSTVTIISGNFRLNFSIGSTTLIINDTVQEMDVAPYIKNDRAMVPLRFFAEALGMVVEWEEKTQQVNVKQGS